MLKSISQPVAMGVISALVITLRNMVAARVAYEQLDELIDIVHGMHNDLEDHRDRSAEFLKAAAYASSRFADYGARYVLRDLS